MKFRIIMTAALLLSTLACGPVQSIVDQAIEEVEDTIDEELADLEEEIMDELTEENTGDSTSQDHGSSGDASGEDGAVLELVDMMDVPAGETISAADTSEDNPAPAGSVILMENGITMQVTRYGVVTGDYLIGEGINVMGFAPDADDVLVLMEVAVTVPADVEDAVNGSIVYPLTVGVRVFEDNDGVDLVIEAPASAPDITAETVQDYSFHTVGETSTYVVVTNHEMQPDYDIQSIYIMLSDFVTKAYVAVP